MATINAQTRGILHLLVDHSDVAYILCKANSFYDISGFNVEYTIRNDREKCDQCVPIKYIVQTKNRPLCS